MRYTRDERERGNELLLVSFRFLCMIPRLPVGFGGGTRLLVLPLRRSPPILPGDPDTRFFNLPT